MSNDHTANKLLTPVILNVAHSIDQTEVAVAFIQEQLEWDLTPTSPQLRIINKEQETISIEVIRDLISELAYAPHLGKSRAFILLSAEQLSMAAQHAFLKSLEEPPANTLLLLVSAAQDKLLPTIRSRCLSHIHQSATESLIKEDLPPVLEDFLSNPIETPYSELIDLATKYKDRNQAVQLIQQLLFTSHQQQTDSKQKIKLQNQLLTTLNHLHANANVRLALEGCFFTIKNTL
jgi:DNA polymerase III delta prime subunit